MYINKLRYKLISKPGIFFIGFVFTLISCHSSKKIRIAYSENAAKYADIINKEELKNVVYEISSDDYEGRETGKRGQKKAADFIAAFYKNNQFSHPSGLSGFFHEYPLEIHQPTKVNLCLNDEVYPFFSEFYCFGDLKDTTYQWNEIIYVGYGIEEDAYSDYKELNIKGKVVVIKEGVPDGVNFKNDWENWRVKYKLAQEKEAAAVFVVKDKFYDNANVLSALYTSNKVKLPEKFKKPTFFSIPNVYISKKLFEEFFKTKEVTTGTISNTIIELIASTKIETLTAENIIATIGGTDLKEEVVVISSHYDHIGFDDFGNVCNGADDNATGTSATMQIAKAFKEAEKAGIKPRRTLVFIHFSGEEKGLLGSTYYASSPLYSMNKTTANLNIDMVGRTDNQHTNPNYVYLIGSDKISSNLDKICKEVKTTYEYNLNLDYTYNKPNEPNRFYYRSDHYNFAKFGVPAVFFFTGIHEDYHKHTDTAEKIDYDKLEIISKYVFTVAWNLAYSNVSLRKDNLEK
ncbi:MAG: M28 family peptidase [Flavobacteriales bacterium]